MIPDNRPGGSTPQFNGSYPMGRLQSSAYAAPLGFNQPTEIVGGYDSKINPMTGEESPETNFAGGGLASLLESKGRRGDTMLVHMHPDEVRGLQALAMAHGGTLTINPETGLYEASFLKKLLPTIIGATLNTFAPGIGRAVGSTLIPSLSEAAATTLGTGLVVGGAYGLIEGDLKKGLAAGLGAYSGANIAQSLQAASNAANVAASQAPPLNAEQLKKLQQLPEVAKQVGATTDAPQLAASKIRELSDPLAGKTLPGLTVSPLAEIATNKLPSVQPPTIMGGIRGLYSSPEARTAFGQALGGGFQSPFMQNIAKTATFSGIANALSPEPQKLPTGGMGEDYIYIPGGFNPLYGTGRDQPYQLPGKYYKRTPQGLVPFNPFALAPGARGFADGGIVDPARDPGGNVLPAPTQTPFSPYFANPVTDPNVAATRSYIEELNRRARTPQTFTYPGGQGLGGTNRPYVPPTTTGGGADVGGGAGVGDIVGGIAGQYLAQKGIEKGIGYLRDKFFPTEEQQLQRDAAEEQARRDAEAKQMQKDVAAEVQANPNLLGPAAVAGLSSLVPPPAPAGTVTVGDTAVEGDPALQAERDAMQREIDARRAARTSPSSVSPAGIAGVAPAIASSVASALSSAGGASLNAAGEVVVYGSKAANAAANAAFQKAIESGASDAAAGAAAEKAAAAATPSTLTSKIIPGAQLALGLQQAYQGISKGNEAQAALGAAGAASGASTLFNIGALGGPAGMLAAAAIAAVGASLVQDKEFGDVALRNYWKGVDQGRGIGQSDPTELAQGFINFYRTNKNNFPGQEKYGRTGNEDFVYDMTQVINDAVKSGKVGKDVDAATMYEQVVQPWLNSMGSGPQNADARRIQDFMMTDLINNFMRGAPISNAQVKGDKKFKIVSEKPVYAGTPSAALQRGEMGGVYGQMPVGFQGRPGGIPEGAGREGMQTPFSEPQAVAPPPTPFSEPWFNRGIDSQPTSTILDSESTPPPTPFSRPLPNEVELPPQFVQQPIPQPQYTATPFSEPQRESIPTPFSEPTYSPPMTRERVIEPEPEPTYYRQPEPEPVYYSQPEPQREFIPTPFSDAELVSEEEPPPRKRAPRAGRAFNYGGAVGEDYNFGFAGGGMLGEYRAGGKLLEGPGDGMSDDIPAVIRGKGVQRAALADGEFVIPADVVSHLGNGSTKAGAKKLYDMMARLRKARTGTTKQAPAVDTDDMLPA